jgi:hypothetical protein
MNLVASRFGFAVFLQTVVLLIAVVSPLSSLSQSNLVTRQKRELLPIVGINDLSPSNREVAEQLEIWPMLSELYDKTKVLSSDRKTTLRVKIRETILESYFDAVSVQAEAEREQGSLEALRQTLQSNRDRNIQINNATNFMASGALNTVGSALGLSTTYAPFPGNFNQMLSGVVSSGMSSYALKQQSGGKTHGQGNPTMLAELFGRPTDERTSYPESVWRFFHGQSLEFPDKTRVQLLEERWIMRNHLERHGSRREKLKIDLVSGAADARRAMTIDDLTDEINMLSDIAALAGLMTHHLRDLLRMIDSDIVDPGI